ncbi:MAG: type III PLP-dependent enzyme [Steroidobacteraceae bacterium]
MITNRIHAFLASQRPDSPCLVFDREVVREKYLSYARALPNTKVYYAVKANPDPAILELLVELGSSFDAAAIAEIGAVIAAGGTPENISYGSTIKKECDIAHAFALGVRLFAVDAVEEVDKVVCAAPGAGVFCRILCDGDGAEWPLSRKCGCDVNMAIEVLEHAHCSGLVATGVSFHVGSQQLNPEAWDAPLHATARIFRELGEHSIDLKLVNLGGGFPARYLKNVPTAAIYGEAITRALQRHFGNRIPQTIIEPGRGLVGDAGVIKAEVVLVSRKSAEDPQRWVYLDVGKFGGLAETMDESIRYPIRTARDGEETAPCVLAGPTCDSADVLYEKIPYNLPVSLATGDEVLIEAAGAYTTTYSSVGFNGFPPLKSYIL